MSNQPEKPQGFSPQRSVTEQTKVVKSFLSQRCIGYTANAESVIECNVEYMDSSRDTLYSVSGLNGMRSALRRWEQVPPIVVWQSEVRA